ncbi:hypothetical protein DB30_07764 [Enhygromyxa salina]|uniref:AgmX/PglI C-terminal domain-containing protein n=1 Tax=Enhygromyxa salina TaxID=215803 RepID=A0A0C1ZMT9_9BACT|nr:hypothetical protein DB30_07764 [Enhygromyxa salina]
MTLAALTLACSSSGESTLGSAERTKADGAKPAASSSSEVAERPVNEPAPTTPAGSGSSAGEPAPVDEPGGDELDEASELPQPAAEPQPAAPALPLGPEPGSPEADAELAELLDESTLTQEEFDAAFRGAGPKIEGDQFVFGDNERPRGRPLVEVGTPSASGAKVTPSTLADLADMARASQRDLEGCYALALGKDPNLAGSVTLGLRFDAKGRVETAKIEGSSPLGVALDRCLVSVADRWSCKAAAGASVRVPLKLSIATGD